MIWFDLFWPGGFNRLHRLDRSWMPQPKPQSLLSQCSQTGCLSFFFFPFFMKIRVLFFFLIKIYSNNSIIFWFWKDILKLGFLSVSELDRYPVVILRIMCIFLKQISTSDGIWSSGNNNVLYVWGHGFKYLFKHYFYSSFWSAKGNFIISQTY